MGDLISRQAVLNLMRSLTRWCVRSQDGKFSNVGLLYDDVMFGLDKLQPVNQQKWIPIDADNMPKEGEEVLFTVAESEWLYHEPAVLSGCFVSKYQEFEIDDEGRSVKLEDVTAWMPLPEPYKPQESEDKE